MILMLMILVGDAVRQFATRPFVPPTTWPDTVAVFVVAVASVTIAVVAVAIAVVAAAIAPIAVPILADWRARPRESLQCSTCAVPVARPDPKQTPCASTLDVAVVAAAVDRAIPYCCWCHESPSCT